jgi:D-sedoheptulose 7-phosphate isomerase
MAAHVAVDLTKNAGVRALTFNEADLITCFANDFGHENWMAKALEHYAVPGDMAVLVSSSGKSPNIVTCAKQAIAMGLPLITLSGFSPGNPLRNMGQVNFWASSSAYNTVEMTHHIWLLAICDRFIEMAR